MLHHEAAIQGRALPPEIIGCDILYSAIVWAPDGIRVAAACRTEHALLQRLARYALRHAGQQLWSADAQRVQSLADRGDLEAAVAHYFLRVGDRWDEECLVLFRTCVSRV